MIKKLVLLGLLSIIIIISGCVQLSSFGGEIALIPEEFVIYQDYIDVIGGVSPLSSYVDTGTVEATVISITESDICPGPQQEGETCTIEPYPNDWGTMRIDKIIDYTPFSEKTVQQPVEEPAEGEEPVQGTTPPYQGKDLPEPKMPEYEPLQEGQEVSTHFLLTTRPVKVRYVPMESSEYSQPESGLESAQESEQMVGHSVEPGKKTYKPIPKDGGYFVFTTKVGEYPEVIEKVLTGLEIGDKFRAKIHYDGTLYLEEYEIIS